MPFQFLTKGEVRRAVGRLIIFGFDGTQVSAELRELLREVQPLGLILFARNIESTEQLCELNYELKLLRREDALLLSVDQEGGRVARVREPATVWPPLYKLGQLGDAALVRRVGAALAQEMRALNFDVDYAPVLDVNTNPQNPVIGDRAFSADPHEVARLGVALIEGLQEGGIGACGKHFPGHGDTDKDSHHDLPFVDHDLDRLREVEWPPFAAAVASGLGAVMTAHVVVRPLDEERPATLSPRVLTYLRAELGFGGVILSDDIEMKAVADRFSPADIGLSGFAAGVDVFLACHKPEVILALYRALVHAVEDGTISHEALRERERRVLAWRNRFFRAPQGYAKTKHLLGPLAHGSLVEEIEHRLAAG